MRNKITPALLLYAVLALHGTETARAHSCTNKRIIARVIQAGGFKTAGYPLLQQLLLTTAFACTTLSCAVVKPALYEIGLFNPSSAMQAEAISTAVLTAQREFTATEEENEPPIVRQHVYILKPVAFGYQPMLAEVVTVEKHSVTVRGYGHRYERTAAPDDVAGYLIDDHPDVGQEVTLPSEMAGFTHYDGTVIAVYTNGIQAVKITHKTNLFGAREELYSEDDAPYIRFTWQQQRQNLTPQAR